MLIGNLVVKEGTPGDINDLPERGGVASDRCTFDRPILIPSGLLEENG